MSCRHDPRGCYECYIEELLEQAEVDEQLAEGREMKNAKRKAIFEEIDEIQITLIEKIEWPISTIYLGITHQGDYVLVLPKSLEDDFRVGKRFVVFVHDDKLQKAERPQI